MGKNKNMGNTLAEGNFILPSLQELSKGAVY